MAITIHQESQESKGIDNRVEEDPANNMPLHFDTKGKYIEVQKEKIVAAPEPSEIDQEREPLPLLVCTRRPILTDHRFHRHVILKSLLMTSH